MCLFGLSFETEMFEGEKIKVLMREFIRETYCRSIFFSYNYHRYCYGIIIWNETF